MCTVTYLPKPNGEYILTSSRDEKIVRPAATVPQCYTIGEKSIVFPKDPTAGGSWIAYAGKKTVCLLNGGFKKHISNPPYKKSRGLVVLDYFSFDTIKEFASDYNFSGIEPFTLVIIESSDLFEFRWDGVQPFVIKLNAGLPYIWSSVTLYSDEVILKRKSWFQSWLSFNIPYEKESIRLFHRNAGEGDKENDILMNRDNFMKTVSITSIEKKISSIEMIYEDLINKSLLMV
jgi:uncharacterized protein with NRDE domain